MWDTRERFVGKGETSQVDPALLPPSEAFIPYLDGSSKTITCDRPGG